MVSNLQEWMSITAKDGGEENSQELILRSNWSLRMCPSWSMNAGHPVQSEFRIRLHYIYRRSNDGSVSEILIKGKKKRLTSYPSEP